MAELLKIPLPQVYELVRSDRVPHIRIGARRVRFNPDEIRNWLRAGGVANRAS